MKILHFLYMFLVFLPPAFGVVPVVPHAQDLEKAIRKTSLIVHQGSSVDHQWTFTEGTTPKNLSAASSVFLSFTDRSNTFVQVVSGSVVNAASGIIAIHFRPDNNNTNGPFKWKLSVSSNGVDILQHPYGDLDLLETISGTLTNVFPSGPTVDLSGVTFLNEPWIPLAGYKVQDNTNSFWDASSNTVNVAILSQLPLDGSRKMQGSLDMDSFDILMEGGDIFDVNLLEISGSINMGGNPITNAGTIRDVDSILMEGDINVDGNDILNVSDLSGFANSLAFAGDNLTSIGGLDATVITTTTIRAKADNINVRLKTNGVFLLSNDFGTVNLALTPTNALIDSAIVEVGDPLGWTEQLRSTLSGGGFQWQVGDRNGVASGNDTVLTLQPTIFEVDLKTAVGGDATKLTLNSSGKEITVIGDEIINIQASETIDIRGGTTTNDKIDDLILRAERLFLDTNPSEDILIRSSIIPLGTDVSLGSSNNPIAELFLQGESMFIAGKKVFFSTNNNGLTLQELGIGVGPIVTNISTNGAAAITGTNIMTDLAIFELLTNQISASGLLDATNFLSITGGTMNAGSIIRLDTNSSIRGTVAGLVITNEQGTIIIRTTNQLLMSELFLDSPSIRSQDIKWATMPPGLENGVGTVTDTFTFAEAKFAVHNPTNAAAVQMDASGNIPMLLFRQPDSTVAGWGFQSNLIITITGTTADIVVESNFVITVEADPLALHKDGSVAATGNLDMGTNSIINVATGSIIFTDGRKLPDIVDDVASDLAVASNALNTDITNTLALAIQNSNNISTISSTFVSVESDPIFTNWLGTGTIVTVEADPVFVAWQSTANVVQVESDPVLTNWFATSTVVSVEADPLFTNWLSTGTIVAVEADPIWAASSGVVAYIDRLITFSNNLNLNGNILSNGTLVGDGDLISGFSLIANSNGVIVLDLDKRSLTGGVWFSDNPTTAYHVANKAYVDAQVATAFDDLGNHTATTNLNLQGFNIVTAGNIEVVAGSTISFPSDIRMGGLGLMGLGTNDTIDFSNRVIRGSFSFVDNITIQTNEIRDATKLKLIVGGAIDYSNSTAITLGGEYRLNDPTANHTNNGQWIIRGDGLDFKGVAFGNQTDTRISADGFDKINLSSNKLLGGAWTVPTVDLADTASVLNLSFADARYSLAGVSGLTTNDSPTMAGGTAWAFANASVTGNAASGTEVVNYQTMTNQGFISAEVDGATNNELITSHTLVGTTSRIVEAGITTDLDLTPAITGAVVSAGLSPGAAVIAHVTVTNDLTITSVASSFTIVQGFVQHHGKNFTITASNLAPNVAGIYQVIHTFSGYAGGNNEDWHSHLFVSGVEEEAFGWDMRLDGSPQAASAGFTGILDLTNNQVVDIRVSKDGVSSTITYTEFGLQIIRIDVL